MAKRRRRKVASAPTRDLTEPLKVGAALLILLKAFIELIDAWFSK